MLLGNRTCDLPKNGETLAWETLWKAKSKAKLKAHIAETLVLDQGNIKLWLFIKNGRTEAYIESNFCSTFTALPKLKVSSRWPRDEIQICRQLWRLYTLGTKQRAEKLI